MSENNEDMLIINLKGSEGSYGHFVIKENDFKRAEELIQQEKEENEEYSVDTCTERIMLAGITIYTSEVEDIDFGM